VRSCAGTARSGHTRTHALSHTETKKTRTRKNYTIVQNESPKAIC
jgi:hypothetical protein